MTPLHDSPTGPPADPLGDPRARLTAELARHPHADVDVDRLLGASRARGVVVRRRRRAGLAGAVTVLALGATAGVVSALPDPAPREVEVADDATPSPAATDDPSTPAAPTTGPVTGRGAVAALRRVLLAEVDGTTTDHFAQPPQSGLDLRDYYASLTFDDGAGAGEVGLNVQFGFDFVTTCDDSWVLRCSSRALPGGGRITTYEEEEPAASGTHLRRVADLLRADGVRVVVSASNGFDLSSNQYDVRRPEPAFTTRQLARVVQHRFWGDTLPTTDLRAGERLRPYREDDGLVEATPLPD